jgi:hypothetical protein
MAPQGRCRRIEDSAIGKKGRVAEAHLDDAEFVCDQRRRRWNYFIGCFRLTLASGAGPENLPCRGDLSTRRAESARLVWRPWLQWNYEVLRRLRNSRTVGGPCHGRRVSRSARACCRIFNADRRARHRFALCSWPWSRFIGNSAFS